MPKCERTNLRKGGIPTALVRLHWWIDGEGKPTSTQGNPLKGSTSGETPRREVHERKAREDGLGAWREKSLERQNPGEQRIVRGFFRGRSTNSQREQGPEAGPHATDRDWIAGSRIGKRHVGIRP